jgi:hypothetical protein
MVIEYFRDLNFVRCNMKIVKKFKSSLTKHFLEVHKTKMVVLKKLYVPWHLTKFSTIIKVLPKH